MSQQVKVYRELDLQNTAKITGREVIAKTANYTVSINDSGKLLVANKAGTAVTFTLPAVTVCKGLTWYFVAKGSGGMQVNAGTAGSMLAKNNAAANTVAYTTASEMIGAACMIWGDGTLYYFTQLSDCTATVT